MKTCDLNAVCWEATKLRNHLLEIYHEPLREAQWGKFPESKALKISSKTSKRHQHSLRENNSVWKDKLHILLRVLPQNTPWSAEQALAR